MAKSVAQWCQERQMTAEQLAVRTTLDLQRVTAIVLGRWTPSPEDRQEIAAALATSIEEIAWGHATPIQHIYGHGPS